MTADLGEIAGVLNRVRAGGYSPPARVRLLSTLTDRLSALIEPALAEPPVTHWGQDALLIAILLRRVIHRELMAIDD